MYFLFKQFIKLWSEITVSAHLCQQMKSSKLQRQNTGFFTSRCLSDKYKAFRQKRRLAVSFITCRLTAPPSGLIILPLRCRRNPGIFFWPCFVNCGLSCKCGAQWLYSQQSRFLNNNNNVITERLRTSPGMPYAVFIQSIGNIYIIKMKDIKNTLTMSTLFKQLFCLRTKTRTRSLNQNSWPIMHCF